MTTITKLPHDHGQNIEQKLKDMPNVDKFQTVADIFKQLGDGTFRQRMPLPMARMDSTNEGSWTYPVHI